MEHPKLRASGASLLALERDQLARAQAQLERSNRELLEALKEGFDPDYKEAVQDNIVTIAKHRARIAALDEEMRRLEGGDTYAFQPEQVSIEEEPASSAQRLQLAGHERQQQQDQSIAEPSDMSVDDVAMQRQAGDASAAPMDEGPQPSSTNHQQQQQQDADRGGSAGGGGDAVEQREGGESAAGKVAAPAMAEGQEADAADDQAATDQGMWM